MVLLGVSVAVATYCVIACRNRWWPWRQLLEFGESIRRRHEAPGEDAEVPDADSPKSSHEAEARRSLTEKAPQTQAILDSKAEPPALSFTVAEAGHGKTLPGSMSNAQATPERHVEASSKTASAASVSSKAGSMPLPPVPPPRSKPATTPGRPASRRPASGASLMPPPSMKASAVRPLLKDPQPPPSFAAGLRAPPTSNRPPSTSALSPSASTQAPAARPSRAITLAPGHSPLDWAALTRHPPSPTFFRGTSVPPGRLLRISPAMMRRRNGRKGADAWASFYGRVYNVTPYQEYHPGGGKELLKGVGRAGVAEKLFGEVHPWVNVEGILGECMVGILVGEGEGDEDEARDGGTAGEGATRMEEMD